MKPLSTILLSLIITGACRQKEMSLTDLENAKWDSLAPGIEYISKEDRKGIASEKDSVELKLKGISGEDISSFEMSLKNIPSALTGFIKPVLKEYLPDSKAGYLKINLYDMARSEMYTGRIYLRGDYSPPFSFSLDSAALKEMPEIESFRFVSREEAKKEFVADGNEDWDKVLESNPLPDCIEITLENKKWNEGSLNELKQKIQEKLVMASDISFPTFLIKTSEDYFFFEYKRK